MKIDPDKFKPSWTGHKIKALIVMAHLAFIGYCFSAEFNWLFVIIGGPLLWFFISKMGMEVGFHRLFCHKSFSTTQWKERMLLILGTISSVGSSLTWVATHRVHHKHADHLGDPQNSRRDNSWWKNWLTLWDDNWKSEPLIIKDLMRDKWHRYIHKHYFKLVLGYISTLGVISLAVSSWYPIVVLWAFPVILNFNLAGFLNSLFHNNINGWGFYRNYTSDDDSRNHAVLNLLMAGAGMHNNHHGAPASYTYNTNNKWYEIDPTAKFVKKFLATEITLPDGSKEKV